jgi:hypothetical protein
VLFSGKRCTCWVLRCFGSSYLFNFVGIGSALGAFQVLLVYFGLSVWFIICSKKGVVVLVIMPYLYFVVKLIELKFSTYVVSFYPFCVWGYGVRFCWFPCGSVWSNRYYVSVLFFRSYMV